MRTSFEMCIDIKGTHKMGKIVHLENTLEKPHKHIFFSYAIWTLGKIKTCTHSFTIEMNVFLYAIWLLL